MFPSAIAPDGRRVIALTDHALIEVDLRRGKRRVVHRDERCELHQPVWAPDGDAVTFLTHCDDRWTVQSLALTKGAEPEPLGTVDSMVTGLEQLAADDLVASTIDYQSRLVLFDGLPLP
jgi:hypothetical protein